MVNSPPSQPPTDDIPNFIHPPELLCRFLASFPTLVQEKIKYAFDQIEEEFSGLIQFWSPVKINGRWLLTTSGQPYYEEEENFQGYKKYRLCSVKYKYNIDVNNVEVENDDPFIITGAPATAFLDQMPVLLTNLRLHQTSSLASTTFQCGLHRSIVHPVFYRSQSCCVGVIEFCSRYRPLEDVFDDVRPALEEVGLQLFQGVERLPYKAICSLKKAKNEIDEALKIICQKHDLVFTQVWIAYKDEVHVAFSSSLEDKRTKQMLGFKLTDCYDETDDFYDSERLNGYSKICYMFPLKMGEGLTGKTLQTHEPHFIEKISELSDNEMQMLLSSSTYDGLPFECSCFVICLKSTKTSDFEYVFEFLWEEGPNHVKLLVSLLSSLNKCLPNYKYASGAEFGDELRVINVENSTESKIGSFKIFPGNRSLASEALEKRSVVKECLTPLEEECNSNPIPSSQEDMIEAAKSHNVKRKCNDLDIVLQRKGNLKRNIKQLYKNQNDTNKEDNGAFQDPLANNKEMYLDENILTIKAEYADDMIKFHLPISSATFADIVKEIGEGFKLNPANYKLKYLDEDGDWILMTSDKDMKVCIKGLRNLSSIVRLRLLPGQISDPSHTT